MTGQLRSGAVRSTVLSTGSPIGETALTGGHGAEDTAWNSTARYARLHVRTRSPAWRTSSHFERQQMLMPLRAGSSWRQTLPLLPLTARCCRVSSYDDMASANVAPLMSDESTEIDAEVDFESSGSMETERDATHCFESERGDICRVCGNHEDSLHRRAGGYTRHAVAQP